MLCCRHPMVRTSALPQCLWGSYLAFKRDNHLETSSSVKQKMPRSSALAFSGSRMTSFWVVIPYLIAAHKVRVVISL